MMETLMPAVFGFLGVLLGVWLSKVWQQANWRTQELVKAYFAMLPAGVREIQLCEHLDFGGTIGDDTIIQAARDMQPPTIESPFLQLLTQCWLLEKRGSLRALIKGIEDGYKACRLTARSRVEEWHLQRKLSDTSDASERNRLEHAIERAAKRADQGKRPEEVMKLLDDLKAAIANEYFR